ncbi:MAG TPA: hypothetical protein VH186_15415 [Chloroflexia bacterium]|nr:hypothetical protein [Chloroflexia bacterium]
MRFKTIAQTRLVLQQERAAQTGLILVLLLLGQFLLLGFNAPVTRAAGPTISFEKDNGETGSPLVIKGSGYDPDKVISIEVVQPNKPNTYPADLVYRMGLVVSDSKGEFTWQSVVPASYQVVDYVNPDSPPQVVPFNGPLAIEAIRYDYFTDRLGGAQLAYGTPEQKARATFNITANNNKGPKLFNTAGSLDSTTFFEQLWNPLDLPVAVQRATPNRGYTWGPRPFYAAYEPYVEGGQNGYRPVIYFDKSRMENTIVKDPPLLTNGLLVMELVSGRLQLGDNTFEDRKPSDVYVAGDLGNNIGPRFSTFKPLLDVNNNKEGDLINQQLTPDGKVQPNSAFDGYGVKAVSYIKETKHNVASVFFDYLNTQGTIATEGGTPPIYSYGKTDKLFNPTFYATGYPIAEPYWTEMTVGGQTRQVLVQLFERRVLTFTPSNPEAYRVEMGNVGLQYFSWRYNR